MSTLHDRLVDLADRTPPAPGPPPPDLWRRGRRYGRRRAAAAVGSALGVALVAVVAAAGLGSYTTDRVDPVAPQAGTVLPDRLFVPSGWLPTADGGSGPLVAVVPASRRGWFGTGPGLVGVSALDQSYAFLDLPGWVPGAAGDVWSLSPDGRWVAFWYGDDAGTAAADPADGVAVLDTATGRVRRHDLGARLGVDRTDLSWAGDTLMFSQSDFTFIDDDAAAAKPVGAWAWPVADDGPHAVDDPRGLLLTVDGPAGQDGFLARLDDDGWVAITAESDLGDAPVAPLVAQAQGAALSPDESTLAATVSRPNGRQWVLVGAVDAPPARLDADLGPRPSLVSWLDDRTLAVRVTESGDVSLVAVDVETGQQRTLVALDGYPQEAWATALLDSPVAAAVAPPDPADPRLLPAGAGLGVLVLGALVLVWRRRRAAP